jgi:hypothetical protein
MSDSGSRGLASAGPVGRQQDPSALARRPQQHQRDAQLATGSSDWSIGTVAWIYHHDPAVLDPGARQSAGLSVSRACNAQQGRTGVAPRASRRRAAAVLQSWARRCGSGEK